MFTTLSVLVKQRPVTCVLYLPLSGQEVPSSILLTPIDPLRAMGQARATGLIVKYSVKWSTDRGRGVKVNGAPPASIDTNLVVLRNCRR